MENLLPYLNVLEADTIAINNVNKVLVIDKDNNIALLDVTEMVHNYINYGTGTQPQIYTITVLTQEEYNALPTKDSNTQYLIVE